MCSFSEVLGTLLSHSQSWSVCFFAVLLFHPTYVELINSPVFGGENAEYFACALTKMLNILCVSL